MPDLIPHSTFLELVDDVLVAAGRTPLSPSGPERKIIQILPADQVLQILAGPGSGKTEMICWRVLYDILVLGTEANRILVTTFTKKAAEEMTVRIAQRAGSMIYQAQQKGITVPDPRIHNLRIGTIHSLCDQLLTEFHENYRNQDIRVVEELEARLHMTRWWWRRNGANRPYDRAQDLFRRFPEIVDIRRPQHLPPQFLQSWPSDMPDQIDLVADLISHHTETWWPRNKATPLLNTAVPANRRNDLTLALTDLQESWLSYLLDDKRNILDFTNIQGQFAEVQEDCVMNAVDHVLVDEFQDTNPVQYLIHLRWVLPTPQRDANRPKMRLSVVGDDDQSIYRFRGSDIACFLGLQTDCTSKAIPFRTERLTINNRSSKQIVDFSQTYRSAAIPASCSLPKTISTNNAPVAPIRLIEGPWQTCCELIKAEALANGYGKPKPPAISMALLMFSTSERERRTYDDPAATLRAVLESKKIPVDNPRNKIAGKLGSPVYTLAALLSYLIDPVENVTNPATGRTVMCWSKSRQCAHLARAHPAAFFLTSDYADIQKKFLKDNCGGQVGLSVTTSDADLQGLITYVNSVRTKLLSTTDKALADEAAGKPARFARLTLAGLVARLLTFPYFRKVGYTPSLFRQSLFTDLLEAIIAPSRMSGNSLDDPLRAWTDAGKYCWPDEIWGFVSTLGQIIVNQSLDDPEVEAFSENAFRVLTFHQSKGLEFDEVYVAGTGRAAAIGPVLTTRAFSGEPAPFKSTNGVLSSTDPKINQLAQADAGREIYVAITRARQRLTLLHDSNHPAGFMDLDPALAKLFSTFQAKKHPGIPGLTIKEYKP